MKMHTNLFSKGMPEYKCNGLYLVDGILWQSIWSYNKMCNLHNFNARNSELGKELTALGTPYIDSKPDFGGYQVIQCYRKSHLEAFMEAKIKATY